MSETMRTIGATAIDRRDLVKGAAIGAGALAAGLPGIAPLATASAQDATPEARVLEEGSGGTLVVDINLDPETLDVHQTLTAATSNVVAQIFEGLVRAKPGTVEVEPALATAWEQAADGLSWTFTLRQGVTFHDGTPFNAAAVKFAYDRQFDPENEFYPLGQWTLPSSFDFLAGTEVVDDYTVRFTLSKTFNKFLYRIGDLGIVSPDAVAKYRETFGENPVGTGPYLFQQWDKGQQVVLARNDAWWGGTPTLDQVVFRGIIEPGARTAALVSGDVQIAIQISAEMVQQLQGNDAYRVVSGPTGSLWFLAMNVEFPAFADLKVRQAMNYAIDKDTLVSAVLTDTADIAYGPLSPAFAVYNPKVEEFFSYDPDKAKALLAEAGYQDSEIVFRVPIGDPNMLAAEEMGTVIQDNLRAVGITTTIQSAEAVTWMDEIRSPENELTEMSWNIAPILPDDMFNGILSKASLPPGFNTSYWVDDEYEELLAIGRTSLDEQEVADAYKRMQEIVMEQAPIVPVCHRRSLYGVSNTVHNFFAEPTGAFYLYNVWVG